jgi:hypothetical protein
MSLAKKGKSRKAFSEETRIKMSNSNKGKPVPEERRIKISLTLKEKRERGECNRRCPKSGRFLKG